MAVTVLPTSTVNEATVSLTAGDNGNECAIDTPVGPAYTDEFHDKHAIADEILSPNTEQHTENLQGNNH